MGGDHNYANFKCEMFCHQREMFFTPILLPGATGSTWSGVKSRHFKV